MRQALGPGALGKPRGSRWGGRWEGGSGWGTHVNPWLIHVNIWQKPLQYCKVISLKLIKISGKNKNKSINSQCPAFFIVQLTHLYMTTGKTIALTRQTFVGKTMSLLFNMLSRLVITFLPRNKHLLINFMAAITICSDFGAPQDKV